MYFAVEISDLRLLSLLTVGGCNLAWHVELILNTFLAFAMSLEKVLESSSASCTVRTNKLLSKSLTESHCAGVLSALAFWLITEACFS